MRTGTGYYILITLLILLMFGVISLGDVLNMVAYLILGAVVLVVVGVLVFRYRIRRLRKHFQQNSSNSTYNNSTYNPHSPHMDNFSFSDNSSLHKNVSKDIGEYVEYEDIQDDDSADSSLN